MDVGFLRGLREAVGGLLSVDEAELVACSRDGSGLVAKPEAVVWPENAEQVCGVLRLAWRSGVPVTPRGSGTNVVGGAVPVRGGVVLSTVRMRRVLEVDVVGGEVLVEAGATWGDLCAELSRYGLFLPSTPLWEASTVGGCIAEGRLGATTQVYGCLRDWILGLEVALPDGRLVWLDGRGGGPAGLFFSSWGLLGVITKVRLRAFHKPKRRMLLQVFLDSAESALRIFEHASSQGLSPHMAEFLNRKALKLSKGLDAEAPEHGALIIGLDAYTGWGLRTKIRRLRNIATKLGGQVVEADSREKEDEIWALLRAGYWPPGAAQHIEVQVQPKLLPNLLSRLGERLSDAFVAAHVATGRLRVSLPSEDTGLVEAVAGLAVELGGWAMARLRRWGCRDAAQLMLRVKSLLDERGIMNPGKEQIYGDAERR